MAHSILIVDDQREVIRVLESALSSLGQAFVITGVPSAEEGLMEARLNHVDLLIADIRLPGMSGLELLGQVRILRPELHTILMTGVTDPKLRHTAANAGADAFFIKPVPTADFLAAVEQILGLVRSGPVARPVAASKAPDQRISERLTQLRRELKAMSVTLVNESGDVLVRAGTLPDPETENNILPSLMSAYSAGRKVSHFLGSNQAENMYFYHGQKFDLVMSPFGGAYALVVTTTQSVDGPLAGRFHQTLQAARREIAGLLEKMGVSMAAATPAPPPPVQALKQEIVLEPGDLDDGLESLLANAPAERLSRDADKFWEPDEEQSGIGSVNADALTYDQAVQLGLAPEEDE